MKIGTNIKALREAKGLLQKQVANELEIGYTNYNKVESGVREPSIEELQKLAKFFGVSVDAIISHEGLAPKEVKLKEKPHFEQLQLIDQLEEDDRNTVIKIIDTMLTKKKFKDFFQQNLAIAQ
jgi:transcriptional regulator with XRE-family HTH domain